MHSLDGPRFAVRRTASLLAFVIPCAVLALSACSSSSGDALAESEPPEAKSTPDRAPKGAALSVAAGAKHSLAVDEEGTLWAWGNNSLGQLGVGPSPTQSALPVEVTGVSDVVAVAAGSDHSLALRSDGTVWAWGFNSNGQIGPNGPEDATAQYTPVRVTGVSEAIAIAAGGAQSLALLDDGTVLAWGTNVNGELGRGSFTVGSATPDTIEGFADGIAIAAGGTNAGGHALALKADGTVWAWGKNSAAQLSRGLATPALATPSPVTGVMNAVAVAAGSAYSLALLESGKVLGWGADNVGQLGTGSTAAFRDVPVEAVDVADVVHLAAGLQHTVALHADGTVSMWGGNGFKQLGREETAPHSPKASNVLALKAISAVAAGQYHSLAVADSDVWGWGSNLTAQLGGEDVGENRGKPSPVW